MNKKSIVSLLFSFLLVFGCFFSSGNMLTLEAASVYDKICTPNTSSYIYIWKNKDTESEKIGKFERGDGATILSSESDWLKVESGSVIGYVKKENILFGSKLEEFAAQNNFPKQLKVTARSLRVRQQPSTGSATLIGISKGETYEILSETADWAQITVGRITGYVAKEHTSWSYQFGTAEGYQDDSYEESVSVSYSSYDGIAVSKVASLNIRAEASTSSSILGKMPAGSSATILERGDSWTKIKAGDITGYISNQYYVTGDDVISYAQSLGLGKTAILKTNMNVRAEASVSSARIGGAVAGQSYDILDDNGTWVRISFNGQAGYLKKSYLIIGYRFKEVTGIGTDSGNSGTGSSGSATQTGTVTASVLNVRAGAGTSYRTLGRLSNGDTVTITGTSGGWYTIEYNGGIGYVSASYISLGSSGGSNNNSSSGSDDSSSGTSSNGDAIVAYALQFLGNPYVYGGTDLVNGSDCSGFTQSIFKHFGYSIPRTSSAQSQSGTTIALSDIQKGDLLFYGDGTTVNHVGIYIGDEKIINASNERVGVTIYKYNYRTPMKACRYWN